MFKATMNHPVLGPLNITVTGDKLGCATVEGIGKGWISYGAVQFFKKRGDSPNDHERFCELIGKDSKEDWKLGLTDEFKDSLKEFRLQCHRDFEKAFRAGDFRAIVKGEGTNRYTSVETNGRFGGICDFDLWYDLANDLGYAHDAYHPDWRIHKNGDDVTDWCLDKIDARKAAKKQEAEARAAKAAERSAKSEQILSKVQSVDVGAVRYVGPVGDSDGSCVINVVDASGETRKFHARNIFDFGLVVNPDGGGFLQREGEHDHEADGWLWQINDTQNPICRDEYYAFKAAYHSVPNELKGIRM